MAGSSSAPVLLYDGECGLCAASVQFVLRRDPDGPLRFAALQSPFGRAVVSRHPELQGVDSVVWVDRDAGLERSEEVRVRSDVVVRVGEYLGGRWRLLRLARLLPRALRDGAYALVARHRHSLAGPEQCVVPTPSQRARFIGSEAE